ncbi:pimeloyl-ACP methyl ester carboxylesterase [Knoellia remsis]|uniref:Pimeloyl-ACP methyl ester carboxylesterase n=1 Tax=Knoellia remsis TaxID=407159 RepID=A0A2T0UJW1_9MICO|nr:alpha/beta hydrolase [Knoellia remsis]PRY58166.1 pimeloyl-ACP methyl ester carboxylesterase [Knoellia remsis]
MGRVSTAVGLGAAAAAAVGAAAAGVKADRVAADRRRLGVLDPEGGFTHTAGKELTVVAADGVQLHVEVDEPAEPDPALPTVVLTHGYTLSLRSWIFQRRALVKAGYRVVLWDQRNHGRSEASDLGQLTMEQLADDLRAVIDAAAPEGPVALVGHSMGGMTTMALARHHADLVKERVVAVALLATAAAGDGITDLGLGPLVGRAIGQGAPRLLSRLAPTQRWLSPVRKAGRRVEDAVIDFYGFDSPVSEELVRFAADIILATPFEVMAAFIPVLRDHDEIDTLAAFADKDALVLCGEGDKLTPLDRSELIAERLPEAEFVVVRDAGHLIMLEHPELVTGQILALLDRAEARSAAAEATARTGRGTTGRKTKRTITDIAKGRKVKAARTKAARTKADSTTARPSKTKNGPRKAGS